MGLVLKFPEERIRKSVQSVSHDKRDAEILFFNGIRYSRTDSASMQSHPSDNILNTLSDKS